MHIADARRRAGGCGELVTAASGGKECVSYRQRWLYKTWEANPSCYWCGRITRLIRHPEGLLPDDAATKDHVYSRLQPERKVNSEAVLACRSCNQNRGREIDIAAHRNPHRETQPRARRMPKPLASLAEMDKGGQLEKLQREMKRGYDYKSANARDGGGR